MIQILERIGIFLGCHSYLVLMVYVRMGRDTFLRPCKEVAPMPPIVLGDST